MSLIEIAKMFGGSETNIDPAFAELKKVLPKIAAVSSPAALPGLFQQGQIDITYTNNPDVTILKDRGVDIEFAVPETGATTFLTTLHIVKGSPNRDAAYKHIDTVVSRGCRTRCMKPPYNFIPVNKEVPMRQGPADEEPGRDVQVRHP